VRVARTVVLYDSKDYQSIPRRESRTVLELFLLLLMWGFAVIAVGLLALLAAFYIDEAWRKILLAVEKDDD
jgi:hypothetical protein